MSEQEIPENYPRCRFCGQPMGTGLILLEREYTSPSELQTVCDNCWELILAIIKDSLPCLIAEVMTETDKALRERLKGFDYKNWEKYVKKKESETEK